MAIENLVRTLMEEFKVIVRAETVVGEPIQVDKATIIPVSKITFGFGAGGGRRAGDKSADESADTGQGIGGGGGIEPVAFIVVQEGKIKLLSLAAREVTLGKVIELVPEILNRLKRKSKSEQGNPEGEASEDARDKNDPEE